MSAWDELVATVQQRAGQRCEYCRMHQTLQGATFHIEHIRPSSRGGLTELDNLALACPSCNLHKSDRLQVEDPDSHKLTRLFNPRGDRWIEHFRWDGLRLVGRTVIGRATVFALDLNQPRRLLIRHAEELLDFFPPSDEPGS